MYVCRVPNKVRILNSVMLISAPNPMFYHLLESSPRDDSNKWSNIGFSEEICLIEIQSNIDISNSDISNSAKLEASI